MANLDSKANFVWYGYIQGPQPCPTSNPYAINDGASCCKFYRQRYDATSCPGNNLTAINDPVECCTDGYIDCPRQFGGCKDHPLAYGKIKNSVSKKIS